MRGSYARCRALGLFTVHVLASGFCLRRLTQKFPCEMCIRISTVQACTNCGPCFALFRRSVFWAMGAFRYKTFASMKTMRLWYEVLASRHSVLQFQCLTWSATVCVATVAYISYLDFLTPQTLWPLAGVCRCNSDPFGEWDSGFSIRRSISGDLPISCFCRCVFPLCQKTGVIQIGTETQNFQKKSCFQSPHLGSSTHLASSRSWSMALQGFGPGWDSTKLWNFGLTTWGGSGWSPHQMGTAWYSPKTQKLVGGLEHDFYCLHILRIIIPIDFHIFQRGRSTTNQLKMVQWSLVLYLLCEFIEIISPEGHLLRICRCFKSTLFLIWPNPDKYKNHLRPEINELWKPKNMVFWISGLFSGVFLFIPDLKGNKQTQTSSQPFWNHLMG